MIKELNKIFIVAKYTFMEVYRSKVMFNVILLGMVMLMVCFVASELTYGTPEKIALDFGLGMLSISAVGIALFMGVGLLSKEIENRTVYVVLSRPIKRFSFLIGKIVGMTSILFINVLILSIITVGFFLMLGGKVSPLIIWSMFFSFFESVLVLLMVVFFSLITNNVMSVIYSIFLFVSGHAVGDVALLRFIEYNWLISKIFKLYLVIFPNFSKLNIKDFVIYKQTLPIEYLASASTYAIIYSLILILICSIIFEYKNLD